MLEQKIMTKRKQTRTQLSSISRTLSSISRTQLSSGLGQPELMSSGSRTQPELKSSGYRTKMSSGSRTQPELKNDRILVKKMITELSSNEKKILFFVVFECAKKGTLSTGDVLSKDVDGMIGILRNSRETAVERLKKRGLIKREKGKPGLYATLNFCINEIIKEEVLNYFNNSYPGLNQNSKNLILVVVVYIIYIIILLLSLNIVSNLCIARRSLAYFRKLGKR